MGSTLARLNEIMRLPRFAGMDMEEVIVDLYDGQSHDRLTTDRDALRLELDRFRAAGTDLRNALGNFWMTHSMSEPGVREAAKYIETWDVLSARGPAPAESPGAMDGGGED